MSVAKMETACTRCMHREVCNLKEIYLKAQEAVNDVTVYLGENSLIRLRDIQWISNTSLGCYHYYEDRGVTR